MQSVECNPTQLIADLYLQKLGRGDTEELGNTATVNTVGGGSGSGLEPRSPADIESHKESRAVLSCRRGAIGGEHGAEYLE